MAFQCKFKVSGYALPPFPIRLRFMQSVEATINLNNTEIFGIDLEGALPFPNRWRGILVDAFPSTSSNLQRRQALHQERYSGDGH